MEKNCPSSSDSEPDMPCPCDPPVECCEIPEKPVLVRSETPNNVTKLRKDGKPDGRTRPRTEKQLAAIEKLKERNRNRRHPPEVRQEKEEIRKHKQRIKDKEHIDELNRVRENSVDIPAKVEKKERVSKTPTEGHTVVNNYYYGSAPEPKSKPKETEPVRPEPVRPQPKPIRLLFG